MLNSASRAKINRIEDQVGQILLAGEAAPSGSSPTVGRVILVAGLIAIAACLGIGIVVMRLPFAPERPQPPVDTVAFVSPAPVPASVIKSAPATVLTGGDTDVPAAAPVTVTSASRLREAGVRYVPAPAAMPKSEPTPADEALRARLTEAPLAPAPVGASTPTAGAMTIGTAQTARLAPASAAPIVMRSPSAPSYAAENDRSAKQTAEIEKRRARLKALDAIRALRNQ